MPAAAGIGDAHCQPECDGQVEHREDFGRALGGEGVDVCEEGGGDERHRDPAKGAAAELPLPGEVAGEDWQHKEADVPGEAAAVAVQIDEYGTELDEDGGEHGERHRNHGIGAGRSAGLGVVVHHDQLLPEPVGVFPGKFTRKCVELSHALNRHQKRLVGRQPASHECVDLLPQVILEFGDVDSVNGLAAAEVIAPLVDLGFERSRFMLSRHRSCSL